MTEIAKSALPKIRRAPGLSYKVPIHTIAIIALALILLATTQASAAKRPCIDRATLVERLEARFGENLRAVGVATSGKGALEIYASPNGTWTVVMTNTNGLSCIMAAGHSWHDNMKIALGENT